MHWSDQVLPASTSRDLGRLSSSSTRTTTMATYPPPPSHPSKTSSKTLFQESIEMNTFSGPHAALDETPDAVSLWAYTTSSALVLLALPLFAFPRLVMFLMGGLDDVKGGEVLERRDALTPLERFLCFQIALL